MSRSYKKTPWCGDHKGKIKKRLANKSVRAWLDRHPEETPQGGAYRKLYCSWNICDYGWICTWEEYWEGEWKNYYRWLARGWEPNQVPDEKECYRHWLRFYRNK